MPTEGDVLGFSNRWYGPATREATPHELPDGTSIRVISALHLVAAKIEAFRNRGEGDHLASYDLIAQVALIQAGMTGFDGFQGTRVEAMPLRAGKRSQGASLGALRPDPVAEASRRAQDKNQGREQLTDPSRDRCLRTLLDCAGGTIRVGTVHLIAERFHGERPALCV